MSIAGLLIAASSVAVVAVSVEAERPAPRERIGTVLGKPIYRDEIRKDFKERDELHRLVAPAMEKYRDAHREEIEPTAEEIEFAAAYFLKQDPKKWEQRQAEAQKELAELPALATLSPEERREVETPPGKYEALRRSLTEEAKNPARPFARWVVGTRKFHRHLYEKFGGGRILFQQAGVEAFDAHRRWLETLEQRGDFTIDDPALRARFYRYWTDERPHRAFLSTPEKNPDAIEEFVNSPWFPRKMVEADTSE